MRHQAKSVEGGLDSNIRFRNVLPGRTLAASTNVALTKSYREDDSADERASETKSTIPHTTRI